MDGVRQWFSQYPGEVWECWSAASQESVKSWAHIKPHVAGGYTTLRHEQDTSPPSLLIVTESSPLVTNW